MKRAIILSQSNFTICSTLTNWGIHTYFSGTFYISVIKESIMFFYLFYFFFLIRKNRKSLPRVWLEKEAPALLARTKIGISSIQSGQVHIKQRGTEGRQRGWRGETKEKKWSVLVCRGGQPRESSESSGPPLPVAAHLTRIFSFVKGY